MPTRIARTLARTIAAVALIAFILASQPACHIVHKPVEVEKLLTPLAEAETPQLVEQVNRVVGVQSIRAKVDIQFEDTSFASSGIAEKYRTADGTIIAQRPGKVYLIVQGPLAIDIAQMTSDGDHFRIAILKGDEKYKRFVRGTNSAVYSKLEAANDQTAAPKGKRDTEQQAVKALSNLRPQHLTDAFLIQPIDTRAAGMLYVRSEFFQSEKDPSSNKRIVRGYYFLDELKTNSDGTTRLLRRFWFNRVGGIQFGRLQSFDERGALTTDVTYSDFKPVGSEGKVITMPSKIGLTRPQDHYELTLTYQSPESVVLDHDYPADAFELQNKWNLPEVDLDAPKKP
jgi:hypothetical protein